MDIDNVNFSDLTNNNEIDKVKEYLLKGGDINRSNGRALVYPVMRGHYDMVEFLLQNGINVNAERDSYNALEWSIVYNKPQIFKLLLDKGAKTSPEDGRCKPLIALILSYISQDESRELIEYALSKGIDINEVDFKGKNALFYALQYNDFELIEYLIDKGIDISLYKNELINDIIYNNKIKILSILNRHYDINLDSYDEEGDTPLIYSIRANNIEMVQYLLQHCDINKATQKEQNTPLMIGVQKQNIECVRLLLENKADILRKNIAGWTAFSFCANLDIETLLREYLDCNNII